MFRMEYAELFSSDYSFRPFPARTQPEVVSLALCNGRNRAIRGRNFWATGQARVSEQDSFIDEVSEEVRRDRLFATFRRYGWIAILLVVVLVGGAAFNEWRKSQARAEAEALGDDMLAALEAGDPIARARALNGVAADRDGTAAAVAQLLSAAAEVEAGNIDGAATLLDSVAANDAAPQVYRDLAQLKSLILSANEMAPDARIAALDPLATPGAPFRLLALEQIAVAQVEAGQTDDALQTLRDLLGEQGLTQDLRRRVQQLIVALGGTVTPT